MAQDEEISFEKVVYFTTMAEDNPGDCCSRFTQEMLNSESSFDQADDGTYEVMGCCGCCIVLKDINYCPWCGKSIGADCDPNW